MEIIADNVFFGLHGVFDVAVSNKRAVNNTANCDMGKNPHHCKPHGYPHNSRITFMEIILNT